MTLPAELNTANKYELKIVWRNVLLMSCVHIGALYGLYILLIGQIKWLTFVWFLFITFCTALGVTAGAHRLWSHRSYKATWQLRLILMLFQSLSFQNHIYEWVRDHRVHHKFTDTDADPHNSKRGFFFSHVGWLLVRKHEDVKIKGKIVAMDDIKKDSIVMFQKKYYLWVVASVFIVAALVPLIMFGERFWNILWFCLVFRYALTLNGTWLVNSAAHAFGYRPYDKNASAAENIGVGILAIGEGWHNYHHAFPWDYKAAELPTYGLNCTLGFIDLMAKIGWAYDLKTASREVVAKRLANNGSTLIGANPIWGWDDEDIQYKM